MTKVITYGTFDLFHQGHYNILKRAKEHGDYLIVGVTGDSYDIGRGKLSVHDSLAQRIENVKKTGLADQIIVEEYLGQKIHDIVKYNVDVFVIGDDWKGKFDHLERYCKMVYLERTKNISSTKLRNENFHHYNIGIIANRVDDNSIISESTKVSGLSVDSVYSDDPAVVKGFMDTYGISNGFGNFEQFLASVDIVFIRTNMMQRYALIEKSLKAGKHVICDVPFTLDPYALKDLQDIAHANHLILMSNLKFIHISVFYQLLWMVQSGNIGDIVRIECSISKNNPQMYNLFYELAAVACSAVISIMGTEFSYSNCNLIKENNGNIEFGSINLNYGNVQALINVGNTIRVDNKIEVIGTKGTIHMNDKWWRSGYFEVENASDFTTSVYNVNFDGNAFKFVLRDMLNRIQNGRLDGLFTDDESRKMVEILHYISNK